MEVEVDLRKNASTNAREYYEKAKKAGTKIKGAERALEETAKKMDELEKKASVREEGIIVRKKHTEKRWYEKFRWFYSSDGLLVVGGRDATTNEILIKKHVDKNDVIFHADVHGAPFFVVKNPAGEETPENTMKETAEAAASYSSAWKSGLGSCDVYYVSREQVSKTAGSGEYLPKGGFMVKGRKNWFRNTELKMAVGFVIGDEVTVIGGPVKSVASKTKHYVEIGVGSLKSGELALEIKKQVLRKTGREEGVKAKNASLEDIQKFIPGGRGRTLA